MTHISEMFENAPAQLLMAGHLLNRQVLGEYVRKTLTQLSWGDGNGIHIDMVQECVEDFFSIIISPRLARLDQSISDRSLKFKIWSSSP